MGQVILLGQFHDGMKSMPTAPRLCPAHEAEVSLTFGEAEVSLTFGNTGSTVLGASPHPIAILSGCYDEAIDNELQFINEVLLRSAKQTFHQIGIKHWRLTQESRMAVEAGDYKKAGSLDAEIAALEPQYDKAEENMERTHIAVLQVEREI